MTRGKESKREKEARPKSWFWGVGSSEGLSCRDDFDLPFFALFLCVFGAPACAVSSFEQVRGVATCTPQTPIQLLLSANRSLAAKPINLQ